MTGTRNVVVLDTCVLFPASLRDTLLRGAIEDLYDVRWSEESLRELARNLIRTGEATAEGAERLTLRMQRAFPSALVTGYEPLIGSLTCHEKDRHVLAAAIVGKAQRIVTINLRDFPEQSVAPHGVVVEHPDAYLAGLYSRYQETIIHIVRQQAAALRNPPMTVADVLKALSAHAPNFAGAVRRAIDQGDAGSRTPAAPR